MINKIDNPLQYTLDSLQKNQSLERAIDNALQDLQTSVQKDDVILSPEAQDILTLSAIEKYQLDQGAAPNTLADVIYVRSLSRKP